MSNYLTKPYEISLWKDGPSGEVKICTIGTDTMEGQNRAFEPIFSRNVNGVKKLSFKIYKKYVDTQTGEEVDNPYIPYLISERKVKLHLLEEPSDNEWHDFIIKNVNENSATHLCTYQLEDALVQELSKNGFGVTLDAKLMNNIGTANELASYVLRETDWEVSNDSEAFVQTIDEALVYLTFPNTTELDTRTAENTVDKVIDNITVYKITGQQKNNMFSGITSRELTNDEKNALAGKTILAFYSSCTGKPHRFQFLYSENGAYNTEEELKNYISNETYYQYYIDFDNPEDDYTVKNSNYTLPIGFATTTYLEYENGTATTLSSKYRGRRYGFSQQAKYIPVLDRYVQLYNKVDDEGKYIEDKNGDKVVYYGYEHTEYKSPALTTNIISNSTFESTSGWTGTKKDINGEKAKVEAVYGYFNGSTFINAIDELKNGTFDPELKTYKAYLKLNFNGENSIVINSGPFDNRTLIGTMTPGDKWALKYECANGGNLTFSLGEYKYSSAKDGYTAISYTENPTKERVVFEQKEDEDGYQIFEVIKTDYPYSEESFKKDMNVRLQVSAASGDGPYYLEKIELFKVAYYNNHIIPLEEQVSKEEDGSYKPLEDRTVEKTYYYFTDEALKGITNADQLKEEATANTLSYTTYKPVYNEGAQKVRTVTTKESNYFNILQSIAETFEAWLTFDITRNGDGGIQEKGKKIAFKNYVGGDNYACFRYGVNLKDIQRTFESKNIVTKLIVKNNSNEHADGGFCTIQRASANSTGENYIYDFQYFFNQGLMNDREYLDTLYVIDGAEGPDYLLWYDGTTPGPVTNKDTPNLQGYFPRIKALNNKIQAESELLANIAQDLTKYKADLAVADAGFKAATSGIEEVREDFLLLTGAPIDALMNGDITAIIINDNKAVDAETAKKNNSCYYSDRDWLDDSNPVVITSNVSDSKITITVNAKNTSTSSRKIDIKVYPKIKLSHNGSTSEVTQQYIVNCVIPENVTTCTIDQNIVVGDFTNNSGAQKKIQEYTVYTIKESNYSQDKIDAQEKVDVLEAQYNTKQKYIEDSLKYWKRQLNQLFFEKYSRFIQEGTWISEEYVDDGLYYADAQSVMYNSCYPQVAYTINVISVEGLPGYEDFKYKLGEKTWVVDPDFFGGEGREPVIITEIVENLDDKSKNQIKVQNFKNQFQDLFQKITATVQQAQYSTGSYEKAVALAEANQERKQQFLTDALDSASARLTTAGQQSVTWGNDGITVKSANSPNDAIKMVGGAILLSKQDENGEQKWVTGVTSDGVSASLITAGVLNAGEISIMNYDEPVFRWDTFGISAYDATWYNGGVDVGTIISGVNTKKFVRFDKHGIYGINDADVDGANWHPQDSNEIDEKSTFALTWKGLKVTGNQGGTARIGKQDGSIIEVRDKDDQIRFQVKENGDIAASRLDLSGSTIDNKPIASTNDVSNMGSENKTYADEQFEKAIKEANSKAEELTDVLRDDLQKQIDDSITTYFCPYEPNHENFPASEWASDDYANHSGDLFYIISPGGQIFVQSTQPTPENIGDYWINDSQEIFKVVEEEGSKIWSKEAVTEGEKVIIPKVGYCYRWQYIEGSTSENFWTLVTDTEVTKALADAAKAQDIADGKRRIFTDTPKTPYDEGDMWVNATYEGKFNNDLARCENRRTAGDFNIDDWVLSSRYTDNTLAEEALDAANEAKEQYTTLTGDISNGEGVFKDGIDKYVNQDYINNFDLTASSILIYNKNPNEADVQRIFSAEPIKDASGNIVGGAVYLAGWTATENQLSSGTIGKPGSFGVYPGGITSGLDSGFSGILPTNDAWVMTAGTNFGITKNGYLFANSGKIGGMNITSIPTDISNAQSTASDAKTIAEKATNTDSAKITNGQFSWKFSPTEGMFMWRGAQNTTPLLKVDGTGLKISGEINATQGGNIGGFTINPDKWLEYKSTDATTGCGMGVNGQAYAFWAGKYTDGGAPGHDSPFKVGHDGSITATRGKIAGFTLGNRDDQSLAEPACLYSNYISLVYDKIEFIKDGDQNSVAASIDGAYDSNIFLGTTTTGCLSIHGRVRFHDSVRIAGVRSGGDLYTGNLPGRSCRMSLQHGDWDSFYLEFRNGLLVGVSSGTNYEYLDGWAPSEIT